MKIEQLSSKSDVIGVLASSLCLVHCVATPLLFTLPVAHSAVYGVEHNLWWGVLDTIFLGVALLSVYQSIKHSSKYWMKYALWISWSALAFIILNEKISLISIQEEVIYVPTLALIALHIYNRKYCNCSNDKCCV